MNIEEAINALKANSLEIDCVEMILTQNASDKPVVYEGKGYIRQGSDGALSFKILVFKVQRTDMANDLMGTLTTKPGRLFADTDFFSLTARDANGRTWKADQIFPRCEWAFGTCSFAHAPLRSIKTEHRHLDSKHSVSIRYFGVMDLPIEFGRADFGNKKMGKIQFAAAGADITVREFPDETAFTATGTSPLRDTFHVRMDEAAKFLTAKSVEWRVLERQEGQQGFVELTSASGRAANTRMDPPITRSIPGYWQYGWTLYIKYLEYVLRTTKHSYWNHCTSHLHNAREASANALGAWAVGLGVAVEGIVELIPFKRSEKDQEQITKLQEWVLKQIRSRKRLKRFEAQMKGLLGMLDNVRVKDRMASLIASGHVTKAYADAWTKLRNSHVHPKEVDPQRMDKKEFQKIFDRLNKTTTFMYEIIFYLIGYGGPHADYGQYGYPPRQYPVSPSASPPAKKPKSGNAPPKR